MIAKKKEKEKYTYFSFAYNHVMTPNDLFVLAVWVCNCKGSSVSLNSTAESAVCAAVSKFVSCACFMGSQKDLDCKLQVTTSSKTALKNYSLFFLFQWNIWFN